MNRVFLSVGKQTLDVAVIIIKRERENASYLFVCLSTFDVSSDDEEIKT